MHYLPMRLTLYLTAGLVLLAFVSLATGPAGLTLSDLWAGISGSDSGAEFIIKEIRLPRTLLATGVGFILGLSGAAAQSLTRNPLAEPAIFGTPQAAAFGAVCVLYLGFAPATSIWLPVAAISFALLSMSFVFFLVRSNRNMITLLLAGLALASLAGAATSFVISFSHNPYAIMEIVFWLMGSFEDRSMHHVTLAFPFFAVSIALIAYCANGYQALTPGRLARK